MKLVVGSTNENKINEIKQVVRPLEIEVYSQEDIDEEIPEIEETGSTFEENAALKATTITELTDCFVFADDSGLEVEALNSRPGVYSARYAGPGASDKDKIDKLLNELKNKRNRKARFVCVIAIAAPDGELRTVRGEVYGKIAKEPKGGNGFGYDPIFCPDGCQKTFAELSSEEKNKISHRAIALDKAYKALKDIAEI